MSLKTLLLMKDGTIRSNTDWRDCEKEIEYLLIEVDPVISVYILHPLTSLLRNMTSATILLESMVQTDHEEIISYEPLCKMERTFTDPIELLGFCHSIEMTSLASRMADHNDSFAMVVGDYYDDSDTDMVAENNEIVYPYFRCEIFDGKERLFKKTVKKKKRTDYLTASHIFSNTKMSEVYQPIESSGIYVIINTDEWKWKLSSTKVLKCLNGFPLPTTRSYTFFNDADIALLERRVGSLYIDGARYQKYDNPRNIKTEEEITVIDPNEEAPDDLDYPEDYDTGTEYFSYWESSNQHAVEFLVYQPYLLHLLPLMADIERYRVYSQTHQIEMIIAIDIRNTDYDNVESDNWSSCNDLYIQANTMEPASLDTIIKKLRNKERRIFQELDDTPKKTGDDLGKEIR